jgi:hypothetical protein
MLGSAVEREEIDGLTYWTVPSRATGRSTASSIYLLANYDEYLIAYRDRGSVRALTTADANRNVDYYAHIVVADGRLGGTWRRTANGRGERILVEPLGTFSRAHTRDLRAAVDRFAAFLGSDVTLGVRPGSDGGQTGVKPGSDRVLTPHNARNSKDQRLRF